MGLEFENERSELIADWSESQPDHAPITVAVDIKDNLTDNAGPDAGNMGALNSSLQGVLGARLFQASELGNSAWWSVDSMEASRMRYVRDTGFRPAVAINDKGQVIEVHDSGEGSLVLDRAANEQRVGSTTDATTQGRGLSRCWSDQRWVDCGSAQVRVSRTNSGAMQGS